MSSEVLTVAKQSAFSGKAQEGRWAWILGFILVGNVYLIPWLEKTPRATDVAGALLALMLFRHLTKRGVRPSFVLAALVLSVSPVIWGLIGAVSGDINTVIQGVRWVLALPWAWMLVNIWQASRWRDAFLRGLFWGVALNVLVLVLQWVGLTELTQSVGLAAQEQESLYVYGLVRRAGMHGHPNGTLAVVSLAIPAALGLTFNRSRSPVWVMSAVAMLFLGSALTLTRSALVVGVVTLALGVVLAGPARPSLRTAFLLGALGALMLATVGAPGGWERWTDESNLITNSTARLETNMKSLGVIAGHPLGIGDAAREELVGATHNAFLQVGVVFGAPFGLLVIAGVLLTSVFSLRSVHNASGSAGIFGAHLFGLFLWEEHLNNPTFIVLAAWTFALSVLSLSGQGRRHRDAAVVCL